MQPPNYSALTRYSRTMFSPHWITVFRDIYQVLTFCDTFWHSPEVKFSFKAPYHSVEEGYKVRNNQRWASKLFLEVRKLQFRKFLRYASPQIPKPQFMTFSKSSNPQIVTKHCTIISHNSTKSRLLKKILLFFFELSIQKALFLGRKSMYMRTCGIFKSANLKKIGSALRNQLLSLLRLNSQRIKIHGLNPLDSKHLSILGVGILDFPPILYFFLLITKWCYLFH